MVGRRSRDVDVTDAELVAGPQLGDLDLGTLHQRVVVLNPVPDVVFQRVELTFDEPSDAHRPEDLQRHDLTRSDPMRGDHVVERTDVIAVQMRDQHASQQGRVRPRCRHPHHDTSTRVDQDMRVTRLDECRRAGAVGVGQRRSGAGQDDVHQLCASFPLRASIRWPAISVTSATKTAVTAASTASATPRQAGA